METPSRFRTPLDVRIGALTLTARALAVLQDEDVRCALISQMRGDWGEASAEAWNLNDLALSVGGFVRGLHRAASGVMFLIQTDLAREVTTVALPEDYE